MTIPSDVAGSPDPAPSDIVADVGAEAQPSEQTEVQPDAGSPDPSQSSQGLIEPYLKDVDPLLRDKVAPVLERFRADQDARVNAKLEKEAARRKSYEQYGEPEQVAVATQILNSFINDPVATTQWLVEQGQSEFGVDIIAALTEAKAEAGSSDGDLTTDADGQPLTAEAVLELLDKREQQKAQQAKQQTMQEQAAEQARQRALSWFEDSVGRHSIPEAALTEGIKGAMFTRANELRQSNLAADGQTAIDMAVAEFGEAFSRIGASAPNTPEPKVAQGGTAPPAEGVDVTNEKARRQAMLDRLTAMTGS